jgi:hypothetical protein
MSTILTERCAEPQLFPVDIREQLAALVRDAAAIGLHVVLQPEPDTDSPERTDLLVQHITTDGQLELVPIAVAHVADDQVLHTAATLRPGDDDKTLRSGHVRTTTYISSHGRRVCNTSYHAIPDPR